MLTIKYELLIIGFIVFAIGVFVGIMKQTSLLKGFNEKRVENKDKLARLVGIPYIIIGLVFINGGMLGIGDTGALISGLVVVSLALIVYVNVTMVSKGEKT